MQNKRSVLTPIIASLMKIIAIRNKPTRRVRYALTILVVSMGLSTIGLAAEEATSDSSEAVFSPAELGKQASATCVACHGLDGNGTAATPENPKLAGQVPGYIAQQLASFKSGERESLIMAGLAAALSEEDMVNLDAYYSQLPATTETAVYDPEIPEELALIENLENGKELYRFGDKDHEIPPCAACHGFKGLGITPDYPRLAGQYAQYIETQLLAYKSGARKHEMMNPTAFLLSEQQIKDVALFLSVLEE